MPVIDHCRPGPIGRPRRGWPDRVITDLRLTLGMGAHHAAEMPAQQLRAEADSEIRHLLLQRHCQPVDFLPDELQIAAVIGAHRPPEHHRARIAFEARRKRMTEARAADVEREAAPRELHPDPPGRGSLLMDDYEDLANHRRLNSVPRLRITIGVASRRASTWH